MRLAQIATKVGVRRFVFASSCSNYGASGDKFLAEDAAFNPVTPYGESKVNVEKAVAQLASTSFSPTFLRASTAYGLSPRIRFDLVVNNLTAWAFTTGKVYLKSDGTPWRPLVHVEDIGRAYVAVLKAPLELVHNKAFNVGTTTENYQIRELAQMVESIVPGCRVDFAPDAGPDKRCYRVDCNHIAPHAARLQAAVDRPSRRRAALRSLQARRPDAGRLRRRALQAHRSHQGADRSRRAGRASAPHPGAAEPHCLSPSGRNDMTIEYGKIRGCRSVRLERT